MHTAAALALAGGALFTVLGIAFSPVILRWMGTPADVLVHAEVYVRIYFAGMIPSLIYNVGAGLLRAVGDSRRPLYFLIQRVHGQHRPWTCCWWWAWSWAWQAPPWRPSFPRWSAPCWWWSR